MNAFTKLAVVFLFVGAVLLAGPVFGFSSLAANRGADVSVGGSDALIGVDATHLTLDGPRDEATVSIENNAGRRLSLEAEDTTGPDVQVDGQLSGTLAAGESLQVTVSCNGGGASGTDSGIVTVTEAISDDGSITVRDATLPVTVDYECTGGKPGTPPGQPSDDDVVIEPGGKSNDEIDSDGTVWIGDGGKANDEVKAGGDVSIGTGGKTNDEVEAGGNIVTADDYTANGELSAGGDVSIGDGGKTNNEVTAGGSITTGDDYTANGELTATEDITVGSGSKIQNGISAGGDISIGSGSKINGELDAGGDVYVGDSVTFNNEVTAGGTIYVGCDVRFNGDLSAGSVVDEC
ncbi:hypothetical protein [Natrinema sp. J7-1]|uniref:hypothetical protein n=1 Tax=Natrinema sp. J7-1 TaxID=1172566 RepID=UPI000677E5CA|nr:hypothetical protein [Natrinema sp. J7-1]